MEIGNGSGTMQGRETRDVGGFHRLEKKGKWTLLRSSSRVTASWLVYNFGL